MCNLFLSPEKLVGKACTFYTWNRFIMFSNVYHTPEHNHNTVTTFLLTHLMCDPTVSMQFCHLWLNDRTVSLLLLLLKPIMAAYIKNLALNIIYKCGYFKHEHKDAWFQKHWFQNDHHTIDYYLLKSAME